MTHKSHRHILTLIAAALCLMLAACHHNSPYRATLDAADSLMESRPDSALSLLRAIPSEQITDRATRARHAMLHAMARDKNYIDDTTFTILQPAINYYENHGTPTEKLRTFYYQGRIYDNKKVYDKALEAFQRALSGGIESNDFSTKGRIYYSQMRIEDFLLQFNEAAEDCKKAARYFKQANKIDSYAHCLMTLANIYSSMNQNDSAFNYLSQCRSVLPALSSSMQYEFYGFYLSTVSPSCDKDSIWKLIQKYQQNVPASYWDRLSLADAYSKVGQHDKALEMLSHLNINIGNNLADKMRSYALKARIYENMGMYRDAHYSLKHFYAIDDSIEMIHNTKGTRNVKSTYRQEQQIKYTEQSRALVILTAAGCILALSGWLFVVYQQLKTWHRRKREAEEEIENQRRQKAAAEQEAREYAARHSRMSEEMQTLRQNLEESQALNRTAKVLMAQRLALLNELIADKSGKHSPVQNALTDMLSKPETFIQSARQTLSITHPRFIRTLQQHNLTDEEIGLCCLYALGLNTKQAGIYAKTTRAYHANSAIRQKLQLDTHVTNLNLYIARMLQQEEEKNTAEGSEI